MSIRFENPRYPKPPLKVKKIPFGLEYQTHWEDDRQLLLPDNPTFVQKLETVLLLISGLMNDAKFSSQSDEINNLILSSNVIQKLFLSSHH